jgi:hypothetical protein
VLEIFEESEKFKGKRKRELSLVEVKSTFFNNFEGVGDLDPQVESLL